MGRDLVDSVTKEWAVTNQATAGTPTISKAAAAGVRHICSGISISVAAGATAQTPVAVVLRDGATGAGTILGSWALATPVNGVAALNLTGLNIVGTVNTAMTLEFSGATATAVVGSVNLFGYDN